MIDRQTKRCAAVVFFLLGFAIAGFVPYPVIPAAVNGNNGDSTPVPQSFKIIGEVTNASGGEVPEEMGVVLQAYSGMQVILEQTVGVAADGSYFFQDVPLVDEWAYLVSGKYKAVDFYSDLFYGDMIYSGREVNLPLLIYETSTDSSALHAERAQVFVGFPDEEAVRITQSFMISNSSNRVIMPRGEDLPLLEFTLPDNAENLTFEHGMLGERFVLTDNGFGDRSKIVPGPVEHQVMYSYTVPYNGECLLTLVLPMDVNSFLVGIPPNGVRLTSLHLRDLGERDMEGMVMRLYTGNELQGGTKLQLRFSGDPGQDGMESDNQLGMTVVGFGSFLLALIIVLAWMNQHRPQTEPAETTQSMPTLAEDVLNSAGNTVAMLLESIASLDDLYRTGKLSEDIYKSLRTELKRRLRDAREKENQS